MSAVIEGLDTLSMAFFGRTPNHRGVLGNLIGGKPLPAPSPHFDEAPDPGGESVAGGGST